MDMFNEARREVHEEVAGRLKADYAKILADTVTVADEEAELAKWIGLDATTTPQLEATYLDASVRLLEKSIELEIARNRVNRKHKEHDAHVRRIAAIASTIDAAKTEQANIVAARAARNNDAFHASVSLASAMLRRCSAMTRRTPARVRVHRAARVARQGRCAHAGRAFLALRGGARPRPLARAATP